MFPLEIVVYSLNQIVYILSELWTLRSLRTPRLVRNTTFRSTTSNLSNSSFLSQQCAARLVGQSDELVSAGSSAKADVSNHLGPRLPK